MDKITGTTAPPTLIARMVPGHSCTIGTMYGTPKTITT